MHHALTAITPRLSAALSLRSVGRQILDPLTTIQVVPPAQSPTEDLAIDDLDAADKDTDAVGEWTGSEDLRNCVASSDEVCDLKLALYVANLKLGEYWRVVQSF